MTEKRQTSQGYIIRILQHFATKLWNISNFVILERAVMKFLSRLVEIKILSISITQVVNWAIACLEIRSPMSMSEKLNKLK
jgi:hypothetical protein